MTNDLYKATLRHKISQLQAETKAVKRSRDILRDTMSDFARAHDNLILVYGEVEKIYQREINSDES